MNFKTGYILERGHQRTHVRRLAAKKGFAIGTAPPSVSLRPFIPPVLDQNQTSSCTGGSTAAALYTALGAAGTPLSWIPSPGGIYKNGRALDRSPNADGSLPPLLDEGANANQVMRGCAEWGIRPMRGPTAHGYNYDVEPDNVNDEPTLAELELEALQLAIGEYAVSSSGADRRAELKAALANGHPITFAIAGGSAAFQGYSGGVMHAIHEPLDHYVWMWGYSTDSNGSIVWDCRNQWGTSWGENGDFRLYDDAVDELGDVIVLDVALKAVR